MINVTNFGPQIQPGRVDHLPFRAQFVADSRRTGWLRFLSDRWTGSIDRDSQGRVRITFTRNGRHIATSVSDPVAGVLKIRDEHSGEEQQIDAPAVGNAGRMKPPAGAEIQTVEGLTCFRLTLPGIVDNAWVSEELQHVILEESFRKGRFITWRMHDIRCVEPPMDLFQSNG